MGKWKELAESMTMKCDRCGEVNPAEIHTCTPKQEQEPVAWMDSDGFPWTKQGVECRTTPDTYTPLYTAPPQREWVGLTDEEKEHYRRLGFVGVEIIETILKEKNYDKS